MKWVGALVLGLLAGIVAALALVYFNPLSGQRTNRVDASVLLNYELGPKTLAFTHADQLGFDLQPADVPELWEGAIRRMALGTFVLEDSGGLPVGIASRATKISTASNLLLRGIVAADDWLVTIPGAGSYFIESRENLWPIVKDTFIDVNVFRSDWDRPQHYELTIGPNRDRSARVLGLSGRFADSVGVASHAVDLEQYRRASQISNPLHGLLRIDLRRPAPDTATTP